MRSVQTASNNILNFRSIDDGCSENWLKDALWSENYVKTRNRRSVCKTASYPLTVTVVNTVTMSASVTLPDIFSKPAHEHKMDRPVTTTRRFYRSEFAPIYKLRVSSLYHIKVKPSSTCRPARPQTACFRLQRVL